MKDVYFIIIIFFIAIVAKMNIYNRYIQFALKKIKTLKKCNKFFYLKINKLLNIKFYY